MNKPLTIRRKSVTLMVQRNKNKNHNEKENVKMKKFELTENYKMCCGRKLFQIRALVSIEGIVEVGETGGYIEKEGNLSQLDKAWVSGNAQVFGNARVRRNSRVTENARVSGNAIVTGNSCLSGNEYVHGYELLLGDASL